MQNNLKNIKLIIAILALIFSCLAFLWLFREIKNNNKIAEESQTEWQAEATRRNEAKTLDRTMKALTEERALLDTHFAKESDIVPFLDTLEELALQAGAVAEVSSVDISKDKAVLSVGLKANGDFNSVYKLLMLLENSQYELEFNSVELQTAPKQSISTGLVPEWNANFRIKLLSFVP